MVAEIKPTHWESLLKWAESLIGQELPAVARYTLGGLVLAALLALILGVIVLTVVKIKQAWTDHLRPGAYSPEQKHRSAARRQFAAYLAEEVHKRNRSENWQDREYAELEAEVEAEGRRRRFFLFGHRTLGVRRERSLAVALRRSRERLILVEGDPGSGKSVALRHVAIELAERARRSKRLDSVLPVYVNLKELKRPSGAPVDAALIRAHILDSLRRVHNRFIDTFLDREFDDGLDRGGWVFLFDSFDEIPDVLSAVDADSSVLEYSEAVSDFLSVANRCRGILASRHYRGPRAVGWSTFRILPLSSRRQQDLIRKATPDYAFAQTIEAELALAGADIQVVARNPMLLGLLCEQMRLSGQFPRSSFELMQKYISHRFVRDSDRVSSRYSIDSEAVNEIAQAAAFAMTESRGLGLSPNRGRLEAAVAQISGYTEEHVTKALNALIYMRLARTDDAPDPELTFAHRRFQEYFVTQALLSGAHEVSPRKLLTDARWRETAVALLQHQDAVRTAPLLDEAALRLTDLMGEGELSDDPGHGGRYRPAVGTWVWPTGVLHILGILHAGIPGERLPSQLRQIVGRLVDGAFRHGDLLDAKLALQVAGPASEEVIVNGVRAALRVRSVWLEDAVYWLAARLSKPNPDVALAIARSIARLVEQGELGRLYASTRTYIQRLPNSTSLLQVLRQAYWIIAIENIALVAISAPAFWLHPVPVLAIIAFKLSIDVSRSDNELSPMARWIYDHDRVIVACLLIILFYIGYPSVSVDMPSAPKAFIPLVEIVSSIQNRPLYSIVLLWWLTLRPAALGLVRSGRPIPAVFWLFPNVVVLIELCAGLWSAWPSFKRILIPAAGAMAASAAAAGLIIAAIAWAVGRFPEIMKIVAIILAAPIGLAFIYSFGKDVMGSLSRWRDFRVDKRKVLHLEEFVLVDPSKFFTVCKSLKTLKGKNLLLKRLLDTDLTKQGAKWIETLREFINRDAKLANLSRLPSEERGMDIASYPYRRGNPVLRMLQTVMGFPSETGVLEQRELVFTLLERVAGPEMTAG
ncbi:MAG TPA: NACHT domain-containing protein [Allosphingosinicella sp.]|nr:NACHT domain-containing protein [Allosphingosinicella sp.]